MKLNKLQIASHELLKTIIGAWILIIEREARLEGKGSVEIEKTLISAKSGGISHDYRQWLRYKNDGQIMNHLNLKSYTEKAIENNWMPSNIGNALVECYSKRSVYDPDELIAGYDFMDQMVAFDLCEKYAITTDNIELQNHCINWKYLVFGPPENDKKAMAEWLKSTTPVADMAHIDAVNQWIDLSIWEALKEAYDGGYSNPVELVKKRLKIASEQVEDIKILWDQDAEIIRKRNEKKQNTNESTANKME
jgi:hypothetical protein